MIDFHEKNVLRTEYVRIAYSHTIKNQKLGGLLENMDYPTFVGRITGRVSRINSYRITRKSDNSESDNWESTVYAKKKS